VFAGDGEFDRDGSYRTRNFRTTAPTRELAETFGDMAEKYRRDKAIEWLGKEMPAWPQRCPLKVEVSMKQAGGATTFGFYGEGGGRGGVSSQEMRIFGETKQLLYSVLPHEVTHTVLAYHFGRPVPRWADEGGAVLSENDEECFNHDVRCREILNQGRAIRLRVLFTLREYPRDVLTVYAQGYSVCQYLINGHGGRKKFLEFVDIGMRNGNRNWDAAVREVYGFETVDELEERWLDSLKTPPVRVAARARADVASATPTGSRGRSDVRTSGLPSQPRLEAPATFRGAAPGMERERESVRSSAEAVPSSPPKPLLLPPEPPRNRG
jgi:hypothetical protein